MKKTIATFVMAGLLLSGTTAYAATSTTSVDQLIAQLKTQIAALTAQLEALKTAQSNVSTAKQSVNQTLQLIGELKEGMTSEQVTLLQTTLAGDTSIYPEGKITGYYGKLTTNAIKRFQKKHGLTESGRLDESTRIALNNLLKESGLKKESGRLCIPPGHMIASGWLKHERSEHGNNKGNGNGNINWEKEDTLLPLCNTNGNASTTPTTGTDTTAPVISGVNVSGVITTGATITWTTNEHTSSQVFVSTVSPVATITPAVIDATYTLSHSATLSGLNANTLYYFVIIAKDTANNATISTQGSFTTSAIPDTTAPVISGVGMSNISSTSATVTWTTNEVASSKIYFGTTSPLNLATAPFLFDATLVTAHTMNITGLATGTTQYVVVESKDAANNTATSSAFTFATLAL